MKAMSVSENVSENKGEKEISAAKDARVYELGYLLVPTIKEEDIAVHYGNIKELVVSLGGEVIADEMPKMLPLAYTIQKVVSNIRHKHNSAYFGWTKFYMDGAKVLQMKAKLDLDPNIVRFLLIKTVKENTIASKRFIRDERSPRRPMKKDKDSEPVVEINKEEVDKEIDAMVAAV